jgi:L-threonylcarbamoyladenylate synthase
MPKSSPPWPTPSQKNRRNCVETDIAKVVDSLKRGGIALLPTDTVYGLAVSPDFPDSVLRLYAMKGRRPDKNLPIMASSPDDLLALGVEINKNAARLLHSKYVPGPLTLALGFRDTPSVSWLSGRVEIAVRIPDDVRMLKILQATGPLLVTSANKHGQPCGESMQTILEQLDDTPDVIIDGGILHTVPSTLVNCRCQPPVIERVGCIPEEEVRKILGLHNA